MQGSNCCPQLCLGRNSVLNIGKQRPKAASFHISAASAYNLTNFQGSLASLAAPLPFDVCSL